MGHRRRKRQLVVNAYHVDAELEHTPYAKLLRADDPAQLPDVVGYMMDMVQCLPADGDAAPPSDHS
ncbi:MAG TPA: hypothetical protein VII06_14250 [Chloroflexota bacterium]